MASITFTPPRQWEDWASWLLGFWLLLSPWALRGVGSAAAADFVIVGLLAIALAAYEMWQVGRAPKRGS